MTAEESLGRGKGWRTPSDPAPRFFPRLVWSDRRYGGTRCLEWTGASSNGYGNFSVNARPVSTHRWIYERWVGPIPDGLHIDHLCRNRTCCNPAHMEPVTLKENVLRGEGLSAKAARRDRCIRGHLYDEANTYIDKRGGRVCRKCVAAAQRRRQDALFGDLAKSSPLTRPANQ